MPGLLTSPSSGLKTREEQTGPALDLLRGPGSFDLRLEWGAEDLLALASPHVIACYFSYTSCGGEGVSAMSDTTSDVDFITIAPTFDRLHREVYMHVASSISRSSTQEDRKVALLQDLVDASRGRGISLPVPVESTDEDGAVALEFLLPHGILGFTLEQDESRSGWYVVTDASHGSIHACGLLVSTSLQVILGLAESAGR